MVGPRDSDSSTPNISATRLMKLRYSRDEAALLLGISVRQLDYRIKSGEIRLTKDGTRSLITAKELERYALVAHPPIKKHIASK